MRLPRFHKHCDPCGGPVPASSSGSEASSAELGKCVGLLGESLDEHCAYWASVVHVPKVEAPATDVVDTIGAGDSFQAALLFALRAIGRIKRGALAQMNAGELDRALSFASACAAITCGRAGADPPRQSDVGPALSRLLV